jgi:lincosamide nucleotidyltransferase A/C/D/E
VGIRAWVAGGWAVDAVAGRQTRPHNDLDIAVDAKHLQLLLELLREHGFVVTLQWGHSRIELRARDGRIVDVHPVTFAEDGTGIQTGLAGEDFHYSSSGFTHGQVEGYRVPCLSIEQQLRFREGYELRPVDRHDIAVLHLVGAQRPL